MINGLFVHNYRYFFWEAVSAGNSNSMSKLPVKNTSFKSQEDDFQPSMKIAIGGVITSVITTFHTDSAGPEGLSVFCFYFFFLIERLYSELVGNQ